MAPAGCKGFLDEGKTEPSQESGHKGMGRKGLELKNVTCSRNRKVSSRTRPEKVLGLEKRAECTGVPGPILGLDLNPQVLGSHGRL